MPASILGLGTALPEAVIGRDDAFQLARSLCNGTEEQESWLTAIYEGAGVETRNFSLGEQVARDVIEGTEFSNSVYLPTKVPGERGPTTGERMEHYARLAPPLAVAASRAALVDSQTDHSSVTHLITVSCTGFVAPGVDQCLINELGLPNNIERTHVGYMGCHGSLNGLRVARAFVESNADARVLLCAVELCCLHYHYGWDPQKVIANALFADGAAAVVVGPSDFKDENVWRLTKSGSCLFPNSAGAMTWTISDHGFEMTLSKQVPVLIQEGLRDWVLSWLATKGLNLSDVKSWAVHPGGPRILDAVENALQLNNSALDASRKILAECGNMSSPTILFILDRLRKQQAPRPCVALGFGPGLAVEAALFV
jgi:predicted naringenin-chalcone synthase